MANQITSHIVTFVNGYKTMPPISGTTSQGGTYLLSAFDFAISLSTLSWTAPTSDDLSVKWQPNFRYAFFCKYKVCMDNICEDGHIETWTVDNNVGMTLTLRLDYEGNVIIANATSAALMLSSVGDISLKVECTDTICVIPVDDITKEVVAQYFISFEKGVVGGANEFLKKYNGQPTSRSFSFGKYGDIVEHMEGGWGLLPSPYGPASTMPGVVLSFDAMPEVPTKGMIPYRPNHAIADTIIKNADNDIDVFITSYVFQSLTWAVGTQGDLDKVITSEEVPSSSPVKLSTDDDFFLGVVPGLSSYPHMDITVKTIFRNELPATITSSGIVMGVNMTLDFTLTNASRTVTDAFVLDAAIILLLLPDSSVSVSGQNVTVDLQVHNVSSKVNTVSSQVGQVDDSGFEQLIYLLQTSIKVPPVGLHLPPLVVPHSGQATLVDGEALKIGMHATLGDLPTTSRRQSSP
eukprot:TRINITY_DN1960_c0_g2_i4.p1 TRINITY_DN1960_c0_g2~~TRINITY_DN1960_c0_g2_i4.p1  ORF type:complete len:463 (+),score=114.49 TRINITY_DN1960_c0_g2_i4:1283-2671(+)